MFNPFRKRTYKLLTDRERQLFPFDGSYSLIPDYAIGLIMYLGGLRVYVELRQQWFRRRPRIVGIIACQPNGQVGMIGYNVRQSRFPQLVRFAAQDGPLTYQVPASVNMAFAREAGFHVVSRDADPNGGPDNLTWRFELSEQTPNPV